MRTIEWTSSFKKDHRKARRNPRHYDLDELLVVSLLANDVALPPKLQDHPLSGEWAGFRDCHVRPDLILIYLKVGQQVLRLVRLGTHSALFRK